MPAPSDQPIPPPPPPSPRPPAPAPAAAKRAPRSTPAPSGRAGGAKRTTGVTAAGRAGGGTVTPSAAVGASSKATKAWRAAEAPSAAASRPGRSRVVASNEWRGVIGHGGQPSRCNAAETVSIAPRGAWAELRQRDLGRHVLEDDLDRQADADLVWSHAEQVRDHARSLLELHHHDGVRHLGGEAGVQGLVHDRHAEDRPASRHALPLGLPREAVAAKLARGKAARPAGTAALHHELVAARGLPEGRHRGRHLRKRLGRGAHAGSRARTSVECVERRPPLPETSATSCRGTCRAPPSPRSWITASETGVMPHM